MGVIGCGAIANAHLPAQRALEEISTVAVCDINEQAARERAEEFEVESVYRDYHDLLADDHVDAVAILLPHHLHRDCALAAAQAGKHILCEKPMAISLAEADDMVAAADSAHVVLMIAQILRFRPANLRARELIRDGAIGQVKNVIRRRYGKSGDPGRDWALRPEEAGGWVLYGYGSHEIDMILWLNDAEAREVYAQGQRNNPSWDDYDEISIEMRLSNEAIASMHHSTNSPVGAWDCLSSAPRAECSSRARASSSMARLSSCPSTAPHLTRRRPVSSRRRSSRVVSRRPRAGTCARPWPRWRPRSSPWRGW